MKSVFVVTSGEYSDYRIEKIFSNRIQAHFYSLLDSDRRVEEYDVDDCELNFHTDYLFVSYNYNLNTCDLLLCKESITPRIPESWCNLFEFTLSMRNERVYKNIIRYGKDSKVILKIAQDKFAEYCYEHNTSKEELIRQKKEKFSNPHYTMYSTATPDYSPKWEVDQRVAIALKQMIVDGKPLPPTEELQTIYSLTLSEVEKEHDK